MSERIIYGINTVQQALNKQAALVVKVFLQRELGQQRLQRLSQELRNQALVVERLSADELTQLTGSAKHQGVAAAISGLRTMDDGAALDYLAEINDPMILVLDGVEDPRNYGACLRTADGAGVDLVVSGRSRGVDVTPVVSKVASGAAEVQPLARVANLARFLKSIKDLHFNVAGLDEAGDTTLYEADLTGPQALVMGAEGNGLRRLTKEHCDLLVRLPMLGSVESLNVSVAAGVCLYEAVRQRS
jgi:23S rRNA (guanosine2251-2'-O)-methyltransferase